MSGYGGWWREHLQKKRDRLLADIELNWIELNWRERERERERSPHKREWERKDHYATKMWERQFNHVWVREVLSIVLSDCEWCDVPTCYVCWSSTTNGSGQNKKDYKRQRETIDISIEHHLDTNGTQSERRLVLTSNICDMWWWEWNDDIFLTKILRDMSCLLVCYYRYYDIIGGSRSTPVVVQIDLPPDRYHPPMTLTSFQIADEGKETFLLSSPSDGWRLESAERWECHFGGGVRKGLERCHTVRPRRETTSYLRWKAGQRRQLPPWLTTSPGAGP